MKRSVTTTPARGAPVKAIWGESVSNISLSILEAFKRALLKLVKRSCGQESVHKHCTGWNMTSDHFPNHRGQVSPTNIRRTGKESSRELIKMFNFTLNSVGDSSPTTEGCCDMGKHSNSDLLALSLFRFVDRLTEYFRFVSNSSLIITLVYIEIFIKQNSTKFFTSTKWIKR